MIFFFIKIYFFNEKRVLGDSFLSSVYQGS